MNVWECKCRDCRYFYSDRKGGHCKVLNGKRVLPFSSVCKDFKGDRE